MTHRLLALGVVALAGTLPQRAWTDPSKHAATLVRVDANVELEVLDWGGSGPPIVLLAGLGDTGHVYDDFATSLTARHRVVAVTRRAHGRSSAAATGYDFPRLAEDILRVIEALRLDRPTVIGHSFAGEEMHELGARYADRIARLVYLDAAFDRGNNADNQAYDEVASKLPSAPGPAPADRASFAAFGAFLAKTRGTPFPEAHLRARYLTNPDGTVGGMWAPATPIRQEMARQMQAAYRAYKPAPIQVPALAIYAAPKDAGDMMRPWYPAGDPAVRQLVDELYRLQRRRLDHHINWFRQFAAGSQVREIAGAHHLFVSHPEDVRQAIDAFTRN